MDGRTITREEAARQYPQAGGAIRMSPWAQASDVAWAAFARAAVAERERILGIEALGAPPDITAACVADMSCSVEQAAVRVEEDASAQAAQILEVGRRVMGGGGDGAA